MTTPRVLIVDDEESIVFAIRHYLESAGFLVDTACELEEAEAHLVTTNYQVMVADLRLSNIQAEEGLDLLRFAREMSPTTKTILLTAFDTQELAAAAESRGASKLLTKPIPLSELCMIVQSLADATGDPT